MSKHLDEILRNSFKRAKLFTTYRLNMKTKLKQMKFSVGKKYLQMSGKLLIIKPFESIDGNIDDNITDRIKDSYFLPEKGLEGKLNFEKVDENPDDLAFDKIAEMSKRGVGRGGEEVTSCGDNVWPLFADALNSPVLLTERTPIVLLNP
ncbi:unnamed protein product [Medioppia subpectinata]|uniref:Uncharacterized protein n=1 Tax=Medioppia subpectinata TaxID=1979941 RepID=A0A7R9LTB6_9ACAR|nr:unnamed protein product [Medioppia subpectinata]CAG2121236.1 unnamed protein product [Medioppia subpectinata]